MDFLERGQELFNYEETNIFFQRGVFLLSPKREEGEKRDKKNLVFCFEMWEKASGHLSFHQ